MVSGAAGTLSLPMSAALAKVISEWEKTTGKTAADEEDIRFCGGFSADGGLTRTFVGKLDNSLGSLVNCKRLSLSTNMIDRMFPLSGMSKLELLSLGRNHLKKIEKLEDIAPTLKQLWLSYNAISNVDGILCLSNLEVLYMANNKISDWGEIEKLAALPNLKEVLFIGNPIMEDLEPHEADLRVLKRIPQLQKVGNLVVTNKEREEAAALEE